MSNRISFWLFVLLVGAIGVVMLRVIQPFVLVLFVAIVLAVLFNPLHHWITRKLWGHERIAAAITTVLALVLVLLPVSVTVLMAGNEAMEIALRLPEWLEDGTPAELKENLQQVERTAIGSAMQDLYLAIEPAQKQQIRDVAAQISEGMMSDLYEKTRGFLSNMIGFAISFAVMILSLYYFLADRRMFVREMRQLLPLQYSEEDQLIDKFHCVCRGVVIGTVVAGLVQAMLAGLAFAVLGVSQLWLLIVLTMFCSFIPLIGSSVVWLSVAVVLLGEGRYGAAIGLVIYGTVVISSSDNLVRAYLIGNQARLHPLVALVTILGALKLIGLWGVFVGPTVAALFYAMIKMARERVAMITHDKTPIAAPASDAPAVPALTRTIHPSHESVPANS